MENLIEHEGKKYRVVKYGRCGDCCFLDEPDMCIDHPKHGFPSCMKNHCNFELVTETNQKE